MAEFNLNNLFQKAFGYSMPEGEFSLPAADARQTVSSLGQPFFDTDTFGREFFMPVRIEGYLLPFPVISISSKKTIVSTPMVERRGTIKELISIEDYVISIKGIIIRPDNQFPEAEIRELTAFYKMNQALEMRSAITDIFLTGDDKVIIKSLALPSIVGVEHAAAYSMELESDSLYTLELDKDAVDEKSVITSLVNRPR